MDTVYKGIIVGVFSMLLTIGGVRIEPADCAGRSYYSIQISSFQNLENANKLVNSLKEKGKSVFWKKVDIPGKGVFYRVYLGKYKNREDAYEYWEKLREDEAIPYCGIHEFSEPVLPGGTVLPPKQTVPKQGADTSGLQPINAKNRFIDNGDGTVTDRNTKLMWTKNGWRLDFVSAETWADAVKKTKNFKVGGFGNWRLPTIDEWNSLIDTRLEAPAMVEPNPFENIITHMPYWSMTEFTYGKDHTCTQVCPFENYTVMLYSGSIHHQKKSDLAFILPVRTIE